MYLLNGYLIMRLLTVVCVLEGARGASFVSPSVLRHVNNNNEKHNINHESTTTSFGNRITLLQAATISSQRDHQDEEVFTAYSRDLQEAVREETLNYQIIDEGKRRWYRPKRLRKREPGKLILIRSGQSTWNEEGLFTGWGDPGLSARGIQECEHAAQLLIAEGYEPDIVYTSRLTRSIMSARIVLEGIDALFLPLYKSWRLNERSYGALTGLKKSETALKFGPSVVQAWRNMVKARPPPMSDKIVESATVPDPRTDPRYSDLAPGEIPRSESLLDSMKRTTPLWKYKIRRDLAQGDNVLVVAHGNSLRGLMKALDDIQDSVIPELSIPAGIPMVYSFDKHTMKPLPAKKDKESLVHTSATFLEKPGLLQKALELQNQWRESVPGFQAIQQETNETGAEVPSVRRRTTNLEDSIALLKLEQQGGALVDSTPTDSSSVHERWEDDPCEFEEYEFFGGTDEKDSGRVLVNIEPLPDRSTSSPQPKNDPVVVFIRHGRTPHNNLALFTGWEDPPLAIEGVEDAKNAGKTLLLHGFQFDVVYTSWLTRAIQTALYVLDEMDCMWVPMIKSWRLNERMYGALTGKSKAMIANEYGEDQLKKWRRGFKIRPPKVSSYSPSYPGNDQRRTKYVKDLPISWAETINRSLEQRKFRIHRKFPKSESLHDCMQRSIPFYTERIVSEAVSKGKRVLVTSHENAIRGILMHLCDIPVEAMNQLHLPNGLPLVYNVKGKCIQLLDDGSGRDPMEQHDFGPAAKYLFKACEVTYDDDE